MKRYALIALVVLGFAGSANAQTVGPEDLQAILNNLGPTVDALADGLGDTVNTLLTTQSAVQTSASVGTTLVNTGSAAIQGAPNLGAFSLGFVVINQLTQLPVQGILAVVDDPSAATINTVLNPDDLTTIAGNLQDVPQPVADGLADAGEGLLQGSSQAAFTGTINAIGNGGQALLADTNYGSANGSVPVLAPVAAVSIVGLVAGGPAFDSIDQILAPVVAPFNP